MLNINYKQKQNYFSLKKQKKNPSELNVETRYNLFIVLILNIYQINHYNYQK